MVNLISKNKLLIIFISFLFNQEMIINNIFIEGIVTASEKQIYRNSGLYPSEPFTDSNNNNYYDNQEEFIDLNNNQIYDFGSKIFKGDEFNIAIKNLWRLNVFSDIQISVIDSYDNYIDIIIELKEFPILNSLSISGNNKIKDIRILDEVNLKKSQRITENDIYNAKNIIEGLYSEENYHQAAVNIQMKDNQTNYSKDVVIDIVENKKSKIKGIDFYGNDNISKKDLLDGCEYLSEHRWYKFWKGNFSSSNLDLDIKNIEAVYKNNGYRDIIINEPTVDYESEGIFISLNIDEGDVNFYNDFIFEGNMKFPDSDLLESLGLEMGEVYNEQEFNLALYNLNSKYMDEGYYFINIENSVIPVDTNKLDVNFTINESEKTKIRKIIISGNDKTYDNV